MAEAKKRLDPRAVLGVLAVILAAGAVSAGSAFAAGGSASGERGTSDSPAVANVQNESEAPDDCPNRGSDSEDSSNA